MPNAVMRLFARIMRGLALEERSTHADYRGGHASLRARTCRPNAHACDGVPAAGRAEAGRRRVAPLRHLRRWLDGDARSGKGGL